MEMTGCPEYPPNMEDGYGHFQNHVIEVGAINTLLPLSLYRVDPFGNILPFCPL